MFSGSKLRQEVKAQRKGIRGRENKVWVLGLPLKMVPEDNSDKTKNYAEKRSQRHGD